jgi:RNA polymerase sigma factor (sigma-70 family)
LFYTFLQKFKQKYLAVKKLMFKFAISTLKHSFMSTVDFNNMLLNNTDFLKPFALTLTRDNETAKDLLQETLYRALANRDKYNVGTNIKAWMYTIMRNIFINNYRRKAKQNTIFDSTPNDFLIDYNQTAVANAAESTIRLKDINQAIHNLPDIFRKPFLLYFDGYKYHEIAEALNEPLGTIKSRIHFARKLLKEQIVRR